MSRKRMDDFRLIWLRSFLAVVEHNSFSAAGKALACDQSTISRHVDDLEFWLGGDLFQFTMPVILSDFGMTFKDDAAHVVNMLESHKTGQKVDRRYVTKPGKIKRQVIKIDAD